MNIQPLTSIISTIFFEPQRELSTETVFVPIKGTSFKINFDLYAKVLRAKDSFGAEHEAAAIKKQLETHAAVTVIEQTL